MDNPGLGNVHTEMGILHTRTEDYESAKGQFQKAIEYFGMAEDTNGLGYTNLNLAQLYFVQKQFELAEKFFLVSEQYYNTSNNQVGLSNAALGLGNLYTAAKDYSRAAPYFVKAEDLSKLVGNNRGLVNVYNSLGHAFRAVGTQRGKEEAERYYQLAKSIDLSTDSRVLPEFSIRDSFKWLGASFNQHQNIYEGELNTKARLETERVLK